VPAFTDDMKRVVEEQRLGFVATVCPDGTPNLSPKGTTAVWDDEHLVFANIRSPGTIANLRANPGVEVNVVDPFLRKGYRFKGIASVLDSGPLYEQAKQIFMRIKRICEGAGGSLDDIVKMTIFMIHIRNNTEVWRARREFFSGDFPASTLVEVRSLASPETLVEIEAIAYLGKV